jgi:taurine dioxygenase
VPDQINTLETMTVAPTCGALGAEITGLDLRQPMPADTVGALRQAFLDHCLIYFRGQTLSEADQVRLTCYFGEPAVHVRDQAERATQEIMMVSNVKKDGKPIGALGSREIEFHSDLSYMPKPGTISMLYAVEIPAQGGATQWCNGYTAYDRLAAELKARLTGLRATHRHFIPAQNPATITDHPIVCTHPETGRKTLFVSPYFCKSIVGMSDEEGQELLSALFEHETQSRFVWTHHWRVGDLVMWDNRATMHRRDPFPDTQRRIMKRTQIFNDTVPVA